jgi:LDH2 family malate/lactate/ureidoglycolate dehydrogenase
LVFSTIIGKISLPAAQMSSKTQDLQLVSASDARSFVENILVGNGVSKNNAVIVAKCLVEADLRGVDTHGM